ncbi:MAG: GSCFA domain-containing protein [Bacteroidota bacterium]
MKFRTELPHKASPLQIDHQTKILSLGSCFADRIGQRMQKNKFPIRINPLGISYNPISLLRTLRWMMGKEELDEIRYHEQRDQYFSFDLHSSWAKADKNELEKSLSEIRQSLADYLKGLDILILTFGTARVYSLAESQHIVANNYAFPANMFQRKLLKLDEVKASYEGLIQELKTYNPNMQILLTVSPIRHVRDGLEENMLSKSLLRMLCHQLEESQPYIHYFPAYEIMLDDLRDYRFYEADLIHPNEQAESYIWEAFCKRYLNADSRNLLEKIASIQSDLAHNAFRPDSEAHQKFLQKLGQKIAAMPDYLDFEEEGEL